jgi:multiple sugar transport system permease protein
MNIFRNIKPNIASNVAFHNLKLVNFISKWVKSISRVFFLLCMGFVMLYPILFILSGAFKANIDVSDSTVIWIPKNFSFQGLMLAMVALDYWNSITKTLQILIPSVVFQLVSTLLAAYGFARFKFKEKKIFFALLIFTIIVPIQTIIIPMYVNFTKFDFFGIGRIFGVSINLLDTTTPFYLMSLFGMGIRSGLYIFILIQFFKNMPKELEEAAMIDGCGPFKTFIRVMIPNVKPAIVTILVFSIVWYWNDFYVSNMFLASNFPLSVNLTLMNDMLQVTSTNAMPQLNGTELWLMRESVLECGCLLVILPLLVMYIFAQRFFTESIERTGIVG